MKIANLNISGGFYIGNEKTEYLDREAVSFVDSTLLEEVITTIKINDVDVMCFQEIITTESVGYIQNIVDHTELKSFIYFELSDCNIVKDTKCGIAILSKFPIDKVYKGLFTNPMLSKTTASGKTYYTYDKGYLGCEIKKGNKKLSILTHHGFPFRRFNSSPEQNQDIFNEFDEIISQHNCDIVTGDFNAENFMPMMPKTDKKYMRTINSITTTDGKKFDDILLLKNTKYTSQIIKLKSDHCMIITQM